MAAQHSTRQEKSFQDVTRHLLKVPAADVVVSEGAPQFAQLVRETREASSDDGADIQRFHLVGVLGDQVTHLVPKL